jgi:amino acid adenylation domain-containing protein
MADPVTGPSAADVEAPAWQPFQDAETLDADERGRVQGPWRPVDGTRRGGMDEAQDTAVRHLVEAFTAKTPKSKAFAAENRRTLADPRSVAGFRSEWKELIYPLVMDRAKGSKIWDIDGNEYVDIVGSFGVNLLGHSPDFVTEAVKELLDTGFAIGPQIGLAGEVAGLVCELTGMERAAFCNTGSEAVLAALRISRTVTGNDRIASFKGHYHGIFDEVLVKAVDIGGTRRAFPIAPGIPNRAVEDALVLDYGHPASLQRIREHAHELACVILEPVRSRNPDLQPWAFVRELRELTRELGIPLIFDEMITGFRSHLGGAQALLGVEADLATYGKVVGGEYPIGVVAGRSEFMDALDGGDWSFGDDSVPEADMTWFAGTFVRHPVALAAAKASLTYLKEQGPGLQEALNERTGAWVREMNEFCEASGIPVWLEHFSSFFLITYTEYQEYSDLLTPSMATKGVFSRETRPLFFSVAHTDEDWAQVTDALRTSFLEMQAAGLLTERTVVPAEVEVAPSAEDVGVRDADGIVHLPLTEPQQEIWLATRFGDDASAAFNVSVKLHLGGLLDRDAMTRAIQSLVDRHEALRTTFDEEGEVQRVAPRLDIEVPFLDLSEFGRDEAEARADTLELKDVKVPFNLEDGPLLRPRIVKLEEDSWRVIIVLHHIVADGWSCGIIGRDLGRLYSAACRGEDPALPDPLQLSEWIQFLQTDDQLAEQAASEEFWLEEYATIPSPMDLPTDRPRPPEKTYESDRVHLKLEPEFVAELRHAAGNEGATLFAFTFAAFDAFLHRITGQNDLVVGFDMAGQALVPGQDLVSHCVSFLPMRMQVDGDRPFTELLGAMRTKMLDVIEYQHYTYGSLLRKLKVPPDPARLPLVSVSFNLDPSSTGAAFEGLEVGFDSIPRQYENNDLFVNMVQLDDGGFELQCTFNRDLFDVETVERRMREYVTVLGAAARNPKAPVSRLSLLPPEEENTLKGWNDTAVDYALDVTLHGLFEETARSRPDAVAVLAEEGAQERLTYAELDRKADALAHRLQELGVGLESPVAVCMNRSAELVTSLLAVLKSGGAYVPVDPGYPDFRKVFMVEDSGAQVVLTQAQLEETLPKTGPTLLAVDAIWDELDGGEPERWADPGSQAYVIYTSGSTGKPKGVMVEHRSVVNRLLWMHDLLGLTKDDIFLQKTPYSFDVSVWEFFSPLVLGAPLVMARVDGHLDPAYLAETIQEHGVTTVHFVPSMLQAFLDGTEAEACTSLKRVVCSGEALNPVLRDRCLETLDADLFNLYGPTEAAVDVSASECVAGEPPWTVPIGAPVANTQLHVLDPQLQPVPIGIPGELYIGGVQVGRGYLNRDELTAERFVADPFASDPSARLYRTGDSCRYLADGQIEFLGRLDHQVKVRGFRIELGEIEAILAEHESVKQAVVNVHAAGTADAQLVTYAVLDPPESLTVSEIRLFLRTRVPDYMVPGLLVELDEMPLTPSGKVDRKALPAPLASAPRPESKFSPPSTDSEILIAEVWADLLPLDQVDKTDNFFELGGHSLLAVKAVSTIAKRTGAKMNPREMFFQTLEQLAAQLDTIETSTSEPEPENP